MNKPLHYVLVTATPTDTDKARIRDWLTMMYGIASGLCESLAPNQDLPDMMMIDQSDAPLQRVVFEGPDEVREAFVEVQRNAIRASKNQPAFAAYMRDIHKVNVNESSFERIEFVMIHLETPQHVAGVLYADILRSPNAPPRLSSPTIDILDGNASIQGGMVGYFQPPQDEPNSAATP